MKIQPKDYIKKWTCVYVIDTSPTVYNKTLLNKINYSSSESNIISLPISLMVSTSISLSV